MTNHRPKNKLIHPSGMRRRERAEQQNRDMELALHSFIRIFAALALRGDGTLYISPAELEAAAHHTIKRETLEDGRLKFVVEALPKMGEEDPMLVAAPAPSLPGEVVRSGLAATKPVEPE